MTRMPHVQTVVEDFFDENPLKVMMLIGMDYSENTALEL
jgi:hypothetical protein